MESGESLARLLTFTAGRLRAALEDLSPEELVARPQGLAPVLWQLGHTALTDTLLAGQAGRPVPVPAGYESLFARGSQGDGPFPDLEEVSAFFDAAHQALLDLAWDGDLDRPAPAEPLYGTVGEGLIFMLYHRGYHQGKIMTLRALLDKTRLLG